MPKISSVSAIPKPNFNNTNNKLLSIEDLTNEQLMEEIQKGLDDIENGDTKPAKKVFEDLRSDLGI